MNILEGQAYNFGKLDFLRVVLSPFRLNFAKNEAKKLEA